MSVESLGVVIPVYGDLAPVLPMLQTLVGPDVPSSSRPRRIIVVDDASENPPAASELPESVEFIRRDRNGGFGAAVNTGLLALADSDKDPHTDRAGTINTVLVLNSDLTLPTNFCADIVEHAAPWQPAVVGCRNADEHGRSGYAARRFPTVSHQVVEWLVPLASQRHRSLLHTAVGHELAGESGSGLTPVDWVSGAALLLPLAEVLAVGGFDEDYFMYTEEVDLQLRLREAGVPSLIDRDLEVMHIGGGSASSQQLRRRWLVRARMRYARRHGSIIALRAGLLTATAANFVWNTGRHLAGREVSPLSVLREELHLITTGDRGLTR